MRIECSPACTNTYSYVSCIFSVVPHFTFAHGVLSHFIADLDVIGIILRIGLGSLICWLDGKQNPQNERLSNVVLSIVVCMSV